MFKGVLNFLIIFTLVFPPGSIKSAYAQQDMYPKTPAPTNFATAPTKNQLDTAEAKAARERFEKYKKFSYEIQTAVMDLMSMLETQRFPGIQPLAFHKPPSLNNLETIRIQMDTWKDSLNDELLTLLRETSSYEDMHKMVEQAETLSLEVLAYFNARHLYLANLSFLKKVSPEDISTIIKSSELQLPIEAISNYQFYIKLTEKLLSSLDDVVQTNKIGKSRSVNLRIDRCKTSSNCVILGLNESKAYRALETPAQYQNNSNSFQHLSRLLVLENYVASLAKLDVYLNQPNNSLNLPEPLLKQHPSLPFLYKQYKDFLQYNSQLKFSNWLCSVNTSEKIECDSDLIAIFKDLEMDPKANLINPDFLKEYTGLLKDKAKTSKVLAKDYFPNLRKKISHNYLANNFSSLLGVVAFEDSSGQFRGDDLVDFLLVTYNRIFVSELLSDPALALDSSKRLLAHTLITTKMKTLKQKVQTENYKQKISTLYQKFKSSLKNPLHEDVLKDMFETTEQINGLRGIDYSSLITAIAKSKSFKNLKVSDEILGLYQTLALKFSDSSVAVDPLDLAAHHISLAQSYFDILSKLYDHWKKTHNLLITSAEISRRTEQATTLDELLEVINTTPEPSSEALIRAGDLKMGLRDIEKNLSDWIQIGKLLKIHSGTEMLSTTLVKAEQITENSPSAKPLSLADFELDETARAAYEANIEDQLAMRFPILSTKSAGPLVTMQRMDHAQRLHDIEVQTAPQPLWKILNGKTFAQAKPLLLSQLRATRLNIHQRIYELNEVVNPNSFNSFAKKALAWMEASKFDENNIQMPEHLAMHLAYSIILTEELSDYANGKKLDKYRQQNTGQSDFQKALDKTVQNIGLYFMGVLAVHLLSWITHFRIPVIRHLFPAFKKASSALTRDSITATAVMYKGQPIKFFGMNQSWVDLGFWGALLTSSGLTLNDSIHGLSNDSPYMQRMFEDQVSCDQKNAVYSDHGCQMEKASIEKTETFYQSSLTTGLVGFALIPLFLSGLPKALRWAMQLQNRIKTADTKAFNNKIEQLVQDIGFNRGTAVSFSLNDLRNVTLNVIKELNLNKTSGLSSKQIAEKIFLAARYTELKSYVLSETTFWKALDEALTVHWNRVGISKSEGNWPMRFNEEFLNRHMNQHLGIETMSAREYEKIRMDYQIISNSLAPYWDLLEKTSTYSIMVRQIIAKISGMPESLPVIARSQIKYQNKNTFSTLYVRAEESPNGEIAIIRLSPYEWTPEATKNAKKIHDGLIQELLMKRQINRMEKTL